MEQYIGDLYEYYKQLQDGCVIVNNLDTIVKNVADLTKEVFRFDDQILETQWMGPQKSIVDLLKSSTEGCQAINNEHLQKMRVSLYAILSSCIKKMSFRQKQHYAESILNLSFQSFMKEIGSRAKASSLDPCCYLLKTDGLTLDVKDIEKISELLFRYAYSQTLLNTAVRPTVRRKCLETLGLLAFRFSNTFAAQSKTYSKPLGIEVRDLCVSTLQAKVSLEDSKQLHEGCLLCLRYLLCKFNISNVDVHNVYVYVFKYLEIGRWHDISKFAAELLHHHIALFEPCYGQGNGDVMLLFDRLLQLSTSSVKKLKYPGYDALMSFLDHVNRMIIRDNNHSLLNMLMNSLKRRLDKKEQLSGREADITVNGLGSLAKAIKSIVPQGDNVLRDLLVHLKEINDIMDRTDNDTQIERSGNLVECTFVDAESVKPHGRIQNDQILRHARFLNSYARIIRELTLREDDRVTRDAIKSEIMYISFQYVNLYPKDRFLVQEALRNILNALQVSSLNALVDTLNTCVLPILGFSCGSIPSELQNIPLHDPNTGLDDGRLYLQYAPLWKRIVCDNKYSLESFLSNCCEMVRNLELSLVSVQEEALVPLEEAFVTDPDKVRPRNVEAMSMFINLVDLMKIVLTIENGEFDNEILRQWGTSMAELCLKKTMIYPLLSGFYHIMRIVFRIANPTDALLQRDIEFAKFAIRRLKGFKDELEASCILCLLDSPKEIVKSYPTDFEAVLLRAFQSGRLFPETVHRAVDALNIWCSETLIPFHSILAQLGSYLATSTDNYVVDRIICFLGRIGGKNRGIVPSVQKVLETSDRGTLHPPCLRFKFRICETTSESYLDDVLSRSMQIALESQNRQVKSLACEFVHGMILFILGKLNEEGDDSILQNSTELFKKIFLNVFKLAADSEPIARQLFNPTVSQIAAWLANPSHTETAKYISEFFEACMQALSSNTDNALRNIGGIAMGTFLRFSTGHSLRNHDRVLHRLCFLMTHTNVFYRLGAIVLFDNIFDSFSQNHALKDKYVLELIRKGGFQLALSDNDDLVLGTKGAALAVLTKLGSIAVQDHEALEHKNEKRYGCICLGDLRASLLKESIYSKSFTWRTKAREILLSLGTNMNEMFLDTNPLANMDEPKSFLENALWVLENQLDCQSKCNFDQILGVLQISFDMSNISHYKLFVHLIDRCNPSSENFAKLLIRFENSLFSSAISNTTILAACMDILEKLSKIPQVGKQMRVVPDSGFDVHNASAARYIKTLRLLSKYHLVDNVTHVHQWMKSLAKESSISGAAVKAVKGVVKLALSTGIAPMDVVDCIENTAFYEHFKSKFLRYFLYHWDATSMRLAKHPDILIACCDELIRCPKNLEYGDSAQIVDLKCFVATMKNHIPRLTRNSSFDDHRKAGIFVSTLLRLSPENIHDNLEIATFVGATLDEIFSNKSVTMLLEACSILGLALSGVTQYCTVPFDPARVSALEASCLKIIQARIIDKYFITKDETCKNLLGALLTVLEQCGSPRLLQLLWDYLPIVESDVFLQNLSIQTILPAELGLFLIPVVMSKSPKDLLVQQYLLRPILDRLSVEEWTRIFEHQGGTIRQEVFFKSNIHGMAIIESLYSSALTKDEIENVLQRVGKDDALTKKFCQFAHEKIAKDPNVEASLKTAAFQFLSVVLVKTQFKSAIYESLIFRNAQTLAGVIDLNIDPNRITELFKTHEEFALSRLNLSKFLDPGEHARHHRTYFMATISTPTQFSYAPAKPYEPTRELSTIHEEKEMNDEETYEDNELLRECIDDENETLEMDILNKLPCMLSVLTILDCLRRRGLLEWVSHDVREGPLPVIISCFLEMLKPNMPPQARIFAVKVFINRPALFAPYAGALLESCVETVLAVANQNEFDYFTRDFCQLVGRWYRLNKKSLPKKYDKPCYALFVQHLMRVCPDSNRSVLNFHLRLVNMIICHWRQDLPLLRRPLFEYLAAARNLRAENVTQKLTVGMILIGILMDNGFDLLTGENETHEKKMLEWIFVCFDINDRILRVTTGEVIGKMLKHRNEERIVNMTRIGLAKLCDVKREHWFAVLDALMLGLCGPNQSTLLSQIIDRNAEDVLLNSVRGLSGSRFRKCIRILDKCMNSELIIRFRPIASTILCFETLDKSVALSILQVLIRFDKSLSFQTLAPLLKHRDATVRLSVFNWMIEKRSSHCADDSESVALLGALVLGVLDQDELIRNTLCSYLKTALSCASIESLSVELIKYANTESDASTFLKLLPIFLMSRIENLNSKLFSRPLAGHNTFEELTVDGSWKFKVHSSSSQMPLFSSSQHIDTGRLLRASQQLETVFSQSDVSTVSVAPSSVTMSTRFASDFVAPRKSKKRKLSHTLDYVVSGSQNEYGDSETKTSYTQDAMDTDQENQDSVTGPDSARDLPSFLARTRFGSQESFSRHDYRLRALGAWEKSQAWKKRKLQESSHGVTLYRKYRKGEIPDIDISLEEIVRPLLLLSQVEFTLGRLFIIAFFRGCGNVEYLSTILLQILSVPNIPVDQVKTIHEILCLKSIHLVETNTVTNSGIAFRSLNSAIAVVEGHLLKHDSKAQDNIKQDWFNLLRLYDELGDETDRVITILHKLAACDSQQDRLEGLKCQLQGEYSTEDLEFPTMDQFDPIALYRVKHASECMVKMEDWTNLSSKLLEQASSWLHTWRGEHPDTPVWANSPKPLWHRDLVDQLMKYYVIAGFRDDCEFDRVVNMIHDSVDGVGTYPSTFLSSEQQVAWLYRTTPVEMILSYLYVAESRLRARGMTREYLSIFKQHWDATHDIDIGGKIRLLRSLPCIVDVQEYFSVRDLLKDSDNMSRASIEKGVHNLLCVWSKSIPTNQYDSLEVWDEVIRTRYACMNALLEELGSIGGTQTDNTILKRFFATMYKQAVSAACAQGRYQVARNYITRIHRLVDDTNVDADEWSATIHYWQSRLAYLHNTPGRIITDAEINDVSQFLKSPIPMGIEISHAKLSMASVYSQLSARGAEYVDIARELFQQCSNNGNCSGDWHYEYAEFLSAHGPSNLYLQELLLSLSQNDSRAAESIPLFLSKLATCNKESLGIISRNIDTVPSSMFKFWIPQLLARLSDESTGEIVEQIIAALCIDFPQIAAYHVHASRDALINPSSAIQSRFARISEASGVYEIEKFVRELQRLVDPWRYTSNMIRRLVNDILPTHGVETAKQMWLSKIKDYFSPDLRPGVHFDFRKAHKKIIDDTSAVSGEVKDVSAKLRAYAKEINTKFQDIQQDRKNSKSRAKQMGIALGTYSEWLNNFDATSSQNAILLPGQDYTENSIQQVTISSFASEIDIFSSKELPAKLTIRGDDERDYHILVKGGDDLRLDQRIQQIFQVINKLFRSNLECNRRGLVVKTYNVTPLCVDFGIIELVDKSEVINDIAKYDTSFEDIRKDYLSIFTKNQHNYIHMAKSNAVNKVRKPSTSAFREYLLQLSGNSDFFVTLRNLLVHSVSVCSIVGYLLGIGDRHLSNMMYSKATGQVFHIDFGMAFGTGVMRLPVPELSPFRFTGLFSQVVQPMEATEIFSSPMINCLPVLCSSKTLLLRTLEVFVYEPTVNWAVSATKYKSRVSESSGSETCSPNTNSLATQFIDIGDVRLATVMQKLEGFHPRHVMFEQLKHNPTITKTLREYEKIVKPPGDSKMILDVSEQVRELLSMATDSAILSSHFIGWEPYA